MQTIPLSAGAVNAHQRFSIQLNGKIIGFEINYLAYLDAPAWSMNLTYDGSDIVLGAMLEPGCDVIQNYRAGIGRMVFVGEAPTLDNLGINNSLVWVGGEE